jgi:hypothetical protein
MAETKDHWKQTHTHTHTTLLTNLFQSLGRGSDQPPAPAASPCLFKVRHPVVIIPYPTGWGGGGSDLLPTGAKGVFQRRQISATGTHLLSYFKHISTAYAF